MAPEVELLKFIIKETIEEKKNSKIKDLLNLQPINWEKFKECVIYHELTPFVYLPLREYNSFLPQDFQEFLKNNYYCALVRCQNLWQEFLRIATAFKHAGITLLPIKGIALLYDIYPKMPVRPMTDIDLLVKEEDMSGAESVFCDLGYRKELYSLKEEYWRKSQCHITFYKKEQEKLPFVELHWVLDFKRKQRQILPGLWDRIREVNVDGNRIYLLSPEDTLFSLALHSRRFGKTLCLKNVYDAALLLEKSASCFDWDYVLKEAHQGKMRATIFFILTQVKLLSDCDIPESVLQDLRVSKRQQKLIQQFVERNTFSAPSIREGKSLYLRSHFLLYDNWQEPIEYIIDIPKEQFAKYYGLATYDKKTDFFYRNRLFYIPFRAIFNFKG